MSTYRNYAYLLNSFSLYLKTGFYWKKYFQKSRQIIVLTSQKSVLRNKKDLVPNYLALFVLFSNLSRKIALRKPCSFHRSRGIFFWGYSTRIAGNKFYEFQELYARRLLPKILEYKTTPLTGYFYGQKREIGFHDLAFLEEFSETSVLKLKKKFGINLSFYNFAKNWINVNPLK